METKTLESNRVHLDEPILAVSKSFNGSFDEIPYFSEDVKTHLSDLNLNFDGKKTLIVFNDLKKTLHRENIKIYVGIQIENKIYKDPPYFVYQLNQGRYLHTHVPSSSYEDVSAAVETLLEVKNHNGSTGASTAILIAGNENGEETLDLYMKLKDSIL
jgi:effector-binding domain-containing protein